MQHTDISSDQEIRTTPSRLQLVVKAAVLSALADTSPFSPEPGNSIDPHAPLTEKEAARRIGVQPNTMSVWRCRGKGGPDYFLAGRNVRYRRQDVDSYIENNLIKHQ